MPLVLTSMEAGNGINERQDVQRELGTDLYLMSISTDSVRNKQKNMRISK